MLVVTGALVSGALVGLIVGSIVIQSRRYQRASEYFAARLLRAQNAERASVARGLHDDAVQRLPAVSRELHHGGDIDGRTTTALDQLITDLRQLARGLHPAGLEELDADQLLRSVVAVARERTAVPINYSTDGRPVPLSTWAKLALFRVAQEAISNAISHAAARAITASATGDGHALKLVVTDDGCGFDVGRSRPTPTLGLTSMQERVGMVGGQCEIYSTPGRGTRVQATLPCGRPS